MRHSDKSKFPTLAFFIDRKGKTHTPPPPPLVEGYPPWMPRPNEHRREVALKKCPVLACRRADECRAPFMKKFCRKTHMRTVEMRVALAIKIGRLMKEHAKELGLGKVPPPVENDAGMRGIKLALDQQMKDNEHKFLLEWQENWVKEMKAKEEAESKRK
jgi:hypothetical protein